MHTQVINTSLVCGSSLAKEGLKRILNEDGFTLKHSFESCASLLGDCSHSFESHELVLIDINSTDELDGDIARLKAKSPEAGIVVLADAFDFATLVEAFRAGADGYILKEIDYQSFLESLRLVALGEKVFPGELVKHLPDLGAMPGMVQSDAAQLFDLLSEREIETLRCLIMGYPNKVIAYRLDISEATVKVHVKAILRKLGVQNRTQAAIWAVNHGLDPHGNCPAIPMEAEEVNPALAIRSELEAAVYEAA